MAKDVSRGNHMTFDGFTTGHLDSMQKSFTTGHLGQALANTSQAQAAPSAPAQAPAAPAASSNSSSKK